MGLLNRLFNCKERRIDRESLEGFIKQIYFGEDLSAQESNQNIEAGVVELLNHGQHSSNGLLVTRHGYFLTANHCLDGSLAHKRIRLHDGKTYSIRKVCAVSKNRDVALAKADLPLPPEPQRYRFCNTNLLDKIPVVLVSRWNGRIEYAYGLIDKTQKNLTATDVHGRNPHLLVDHFQMSQWSGRPGYSGSPICSEDGRLVGFASTGDAGIGSGVKLITALELIHFYKRNMP